MAEQFMKFDDGKLQYSLIPPEVLEEMAKIFTYGANKYEKNNWRKNKDLDRYVDALYRHMEAWRAGEINDKESGYNHLSHAITNLAFLISLTKEKEL